MKFGSLNDLWSFKNDSNNSIIGNDNLVGEESLSLGEGKGIPPMGMEIGPLGNLETGDNELLVEKGVGPLAVGLGEDDFNLDMDPIQSTMNSRIENDFVTPMELINMTEKSSANCPVDESIFNQMDIVFKQH